MSVTHDRFCCERDQSAISHPPRGTEVLPQGISREDGTGSMAMSPCRPHWRALANSLSYETANPDYSPNSYPPYCWARVVLVVVPLSPWLSLVSSGLVPLRPLDAQITWKTQRKDFTPSVLQV